MLMPAIEAEAEVEAFLASHAELSDEQGRRRIVRNGHAPERQIQTGIGPVEVRRPRVRDRAADDGQPIRFTSTILPWLYLKGVSTGQFTEALAARRCSGRERLACRPRPFGG
jgi:putative transposase